MTPVESKSWRVLKTDALATATCPVANCPICRPLDGYQLKCACPECGTYGKHFIGLPDHANVDGERAWNVARECFECGNRWGQR